MNFEAIQQLIEQHQDSVDFGSPENAPSAEAIARTEKAIGKPLPPSYKAFLAQYGYGTISGDALFHVFNQATEVTQVMEDLAYQYQTSLKNEMYPAHEVPILENDYDETYLFDTSVEKNGEYLIVRKTFENEPFAENYVEFVEKLFAVYFG